MIGEKQMRDRAHPSGFMILDFGDTLILIITLENNVL